MVRVVAVVVVVVVLVLVLVVFVTGGKQSQLLVLGKRLGVRQKKIQVLVLSVKLQFK